MMLLTDNDTRALSDLLKNPFTQQKLVSIHIYGFPGTDKPWSATIGFRNGKTQGQQLFEDYADMGTMVLEIDRFLNTLPL